MITHLQKKVIVNNIHCILKNFSTLLVQRMSLLVKSPSEGWRILNHKILSTRFALEGVASLSNERIVIKISIAPTTSLQA